MRIAGHVAVFFLAGIAAAQVDTGAMPGSVKDQSGAVIPSAKVTLINEGTAQTTIAPLPIVHCVIEEVLVLTAQRFEKRFQ